MLSERLYHEIIDSSIEPYTEHPGNSPRLCPAVWLHGHGHGEWRALVPYGGATGCAG